MRKLLAYKLIFEFFGLGVNLHNHGVSGMHGLMCYSGGKCYLYGMVG